MANNFHPQNNSADCDLDQQLDRALESYLSQPRAGLEQRILARAKSIPPRSFWLQPRFAFLAVSAVAACALAASFLAMPGKQSAPRRANAVVSKASPSHPAAPPPAPAATAAPTATALLTPKPTPKLTAIRKPHHTPHTPSESNLPRLAVFPAPAPPTLQERELAELAVRHPKLLQEAFKPIPKAKAEPITIQPIQIQPITIKPLSVAQNDHHQSPISHHPENAP